MKASDLPDTGASGSHVTEPLLIAAVDRELEPDEARDVESHLASCPLCRDRYAELAGLSEQVHELTARVPAPGSDTARERLSAALACQPREDSTERAFERALQRYGWAVAAAAVLAVCAIVLHSTVWHSDVMPANVLLSGTSQAVSGRVPVAHAQTASIDINGERFLPLPYSNEDLPLNSSHVVEMQVPLSSLASAGIVLEPGSISVAGAERTALADVLVGMDGQPLGVHVLRVN